MAITVDAAFKKFNKEYGKDIAKFGFLEEERPRLGTGLYGLDSILGGGFPMGRVSIVYGNESACKTNVCLLAIATAQREYPDKVAVFVDVEGHYDSQWAARLGVDIDKLGYILPGNAEEAIDVIINLLYADNLSVIVVDSLAAMVTTGELEKSAEGTPMGKTGLAINKFYRKAGVALGQAKLEGVYPTLICINQIRHKMVQMGSPEVLVGGLAFNFISSLTLRLSSQDEVIKEIHPTLPIYKKLTAIVKKSKIPILQKKGEFMLAVRPDPRYGIEIGQSYDWPVIKSQLSKFELLTKRLPKGWQLTWADTGEIEEFDKQDELKEKMYEDVEYGARLKKMLINHYLASDGMIEMGDAPKSKEVWFQKDK